MATKKNSKRRKPTVTEAQPSKAVATAPQRPAPRPELGGPRRRSRVAVKPSGKPAAKITKAIAAHAKARAAREARD